MSLRTVLPGIAAALSLSAGEAAGQPLAVALAELEPIEATAEACELALSEDRDKRLAVAAALGWTFRLVGDDVILDHLASDPDAAVRRAAARAASVRRAER